MEGVQFAFLHNWSGLYNIYSASGRKEIWNICCWGLNVYVLQKIVEILNASVDGEALGKWFNHEGGCFMNGISALIKKDVFHRMRIKWEASDPEEGSQLSCWHPYVELPTSRGVSNTHLLFISFPGWYFVITVLIE